MSTLETHYQNYLKENPHSTLTFKEWLNQWKRIATELIEHDDDISVWDVTLTDGLEDEDDFEYKDVEEDYLIPIKELKQLN